MNEFHRKKIAITARRKCVFVVFSYDQCEITMPQYDDQLKYILYNSNLSLSRIIETIPKRIRKYRYVFISNLKVMYSKHRLPLDISISPIRNQDMYHHIKTENILFVSLNPIVIIILPFLLWPKEVLAGILIISSFKNGLALRKVDATYITQNILLHLLQLFATHLATWRHRVGRSTLVLQQTNH